MPRRSTALAVLLAVAIVPYFIDLGGSSIWDANEAFYVETPREMMERGDYVSPTFNYEPRLNKPVLSYWIVAGFYSCSGSRSACSDCRSRSARGDPDPDRGLLLAPRRRPIRAMPPARSRAVGGARPRDHAAPADVRAPHLHRRLHLDVLRAHAAVLRAGGALSGAPATCLVLMYVAVGLGVLTKGPVAIVLPALAFGLYLLVHRELRPASLDDAAARRADRRGNRRAVVRRALSAHGWAPLGEFIFGENVARYTAGVGYVDSVRGPFFYLPVLFSDSFPWSMFLVRRGRRLVAETARRRGDARRRSASAPCCCCGSSSSSCSSAPRRPSRISTSFRSFRPSRRWPA